MAAAGSGCAVIGLYAVLAEQGTKALDLIAELADMLAVTVETEISRRQVSAAG